MPADYLAVDALTYTRESLENALEWIHDHLADHYGVKTISGESYLPDPLNEIMAALYGIASDVTAMAVQVGDYRRGDDGALLRPVNYSNTHPVYAQSQAGTVGQKCHPLHLTHPDGRSCPAKDAGARRAELNLIPGGDRNE